MEHNKFLLRMLKEQISENVELKAKLREYEERPPVPLYSRRPHPSSPDFDNMVNKVQRCRDNIEFVSAQIDYLLPSVAENNGAVPKAKPSVAEKNGAVPTAEPFFVGNAKPQAWKSRVDQQDTAQSSSSDEWYSFPRMPRKA